MARYSDKKPLFCDALTRALLPIVSAARNASDIDSKMLTFAVDGIKFAQQWTRSTTEADRRLVAQQVAMIEDRTTRAQASPVHSAVFLYAQALKAFVACDYRAALTLADNATKALG